MMVSVFDQPFALQRQLAALVTELRPPPRELLRPQVPAISDAATQPWHERNSPDNRPATPAKGTSELTLRRQRTGTPWAVVVGTMFLVGLVGVGLWWNEQQTLPPDVRTPPAAVAPAPSPSTDLPPAPPAPAEAARPSAESEPDAGEEEEPQGTGTILHRPSSAPEPAATTAPVRAPKRARNRATAAPDRTSEAPETARERGSKTRSGASVSVDDF